MTSKSLTSKEMKSLTMKYFSMFSGIGGFELGIDRAIRQLQQELAGHDNSQDNKNERGLLDSGATCVGYSEIDKYAIKVYERNFNESCDEHAHISQESKQEERTQGRKRSTDKQGLQLHDRNRSATLCNKCKGHINYGNATTINAAELPDFDLLVGGFPCQAFSIAGKRAGFDDTRGTLFFDIARILKEKQPRNLVLENVKGLLSHDGGRTFTTIIGVLADLGYFVEWQVLNSKDFGVPQNRERVIIVGHLGAECSGQVFPITGSSQQIASVAGYISEEVWPRRHEQIRRTYNTDGAMPTIPTGQGGGVMTKIAITPKIVVPRNRRTELVESDISSTLTSHYRGSPDGDGRPGVKEGLRIRRLTPKECERLQGFPDDWTKYGEDEHGMRVDISDTQRYKMCGNAVTTNVIQAVISKLFAITKSDTQEKEVEV